MRRLLMFTASVEIGTGLVLAVAPAVVAKWLLGAEVAGVGAVIGRCFGVALLGLGLACWPSRNPADGGTAARGMLAYNGLLAIYLAYLGGVERMSGLLLWPAVALHGGVAVWLAVARRAAR